LASSWVADSSNVIISAFAELEKELIRERIVADVKAATANGKTLGVRAGCFAAMKRSGSAPKV
jgi:DNA invertase Pin-like site-specific DNA recombinase